MPMCVRLALEEDIDDLAEMTRAALAEARPWLEYDDHKARETFWSYIDTADPTIFVAEDEDGLAGFVVASINEYRMSGGLFILHEVFFVRPEKRGTRAAARLIEHLLEWGQSLGAVEIIGGNDSNLKSDKVARFLERFGFEPVGYAMRKVF